MHLANIPRKYFLFGRAISLLLLFIFCSLSVHAATYNLSTGSYPPCSSGTWSVSGSTYTCSNIVTLASGDTIVANVNSTIVATNGFVLAGNTIGSAAANVNLTSTFATGASTGTNTIYGNVTVGVGSVAGANVTINGNLTVRNNIDLTGGAVTGRITATDGYIKTTGTNIGGGATSNGNMTFSGGTIAGSILSQYGSVDFSGVTMPSGSIVALNAVNILSDSMLGSASASITISTTNSPITVDDSIVYGHLTATNQSWGVVNVRNGAAVYGTCLPRSDPVNACNAAPPVISCPTSQLAAGIMGDYFNNATLTAPVTATRLDGPINFNWGFGTPGPAGIPDNNFSVRWDGYVYVTQAGVHSFQVNADDGVRLTVNGILLINRWDNAGLSQGYDVNMAAGQAYPIKMEFNDKAGVANVNLSWKTPGSNLHVVIPRGVNGTPPSAGLYQCNSLANYAISHSGTGVTCEGAPITFRALDSLGNVVTPPPGTTLTLGTLPSGSLWVGGNTVVFDGVATAVTKILRQPTPATVNINVVDNNGIRESSAFDPSIVFGEAALIFSNIPTEVAGVVDGNPTLKSIKTDSGTGACVPQLIGNTTVKIAYSCRNPATCVAGQQLTLNNQTAKANNTGAPITYLDATLNFDASGMASIPLKYTDVGQVLLHARIDLTGPPPVVIMGSSNPFVVKPYTLKVTSVAQAAAPFTPNPGTTNTGAGFIAASETFNVTVQSFNSAGAITPNFGNEVPTSERENIELLMGCPERDDENDAPCANRKPDYPSGGSAGNLGVSSDPPIATAAGGVLLANWNEVGSFRLEANLSDPGYLGTGTVVKVTPSSVIGRFYPDKFKLSNTDLITTCTIDDTVVPPQQFHYMGKVFNIENADIEAVGLKFLLHALNKFDQVVGNYDSAKLYDTASVDFHTFTASQDLSTRLVNNLGTPLIPGAWVNGVIDINQPQAQFGRLATPDGPYSNVKIAISVEDCLDKRPLEDKNLILDTTGGCGAPDNNAYELARFDARFGRLRLDDAFGPATADLPVNFSTQYWTGTHFAQHIDDSCTKILRSAIQYPAGSILIPANLTVALNGGSTTGIYADISTTEISFFGGDAGHFFTAPNGNATGNFPVEVDLTSYPWLRFDWDQNGVYDDVNLPTARFGFGSYRGHDRVIYWREILQ